MKSLHSRLDNKKEEVLEVTRTFGLFKAMQQFDVSDYACFTKWLQEVTGDEHFGLHPKIKSDLHQTLGDQLVVAFLNKVAQLKSENEKLRQRAEYLEWQLSRSSEREQSQALAILHSCEV